MKSFRRSNCLNDICEFKILKKLDNPYVIKVFESFVNKEGHFCFIMEYCQVMKLFINFQNTNNVIDNNKNLREIPYEFK